MPPSRPYLELYTPRSEWVEGPGLLDLLNWTEEDRRRAFTRSALKRVKLDMLKRNALIAAGNALMEREDDRCERGSRPSLGTPPNRRWYGRQRGRR